MKLIKIFSVLIFSFCYSSTLLAQEAWGFFINMPDEMVPYLTQSQKKEMVEMYRMGVDSNTKNKFDEMSSVDTLSADYARFNLSSTRKLEIMLLPYNETDTLLCTLNTYSGSAEYGEIEFYDTKWNKKDVSEFMPELNLPGDLLSKPDDMTENKYQELVKLVDPYFMKYTLQPQSKEVEINLSLIYDTLDQKQEIAPILSKRTLIWDGKTFN